MIPEVVNMLSCRPHKFMEYQVVEKAENCRFQLELAEKRIGIPANLYRSTVRRLSDLVVQRWQNPHFQRRVFPIFHDYYSYT